MVCLRSLPVHIVHRSCDVAQYPKALSTPELIRTARYGMKLPWDRSSARRCQFLYHDTRTTSTLGVQRCAYKCLDQHLQLRQNPSFTVNCGNYQIGLSYCGEVAGEPSVASTVCLSELEIQSSQAFPSSAPASTLSGMRSIG